MPKRRSPKKVPTKKSREAARQNKRRARPELSERDVYHYEGTGAAHQQLCNALCGPMFNEDGIIPLVNNRFFVIAADKNNAESVALTSTEIPVDFDVSTSCSGFKVGEVLHKNKKVTNDLGITRGQGAITAELLRKIAALIALGQVTQQQMLQQQHEQMMAVLTGHSAIVSGGDVEQRRTKKQRKNAIKEETNRDGGGSKFNITGDLNPFKKLTDITSLKKDLCVSLYSPTYEKEEWFMNEEEMVERLENDSRLKKKWDNLGALLDFGFKHKGWFVHHINHAHPTFMPPNRY